jgi:hypothetical protein
MALGFAGEPAARRVLMSGESRVSILGPNSTQAGERIRSPGLRCVMKISRGPGRAGPKLASEPIFCLRILSFFHFQK